MKYRYARDLRHPGARIRQHRFEWHNGYNPSGHAEGGPSGGKIGGDCGLFDMTLSSMIVVFFLFAACREIVSVVSN